MAVLIPSFAYAIVVDELTQCVSIELELPTSPLLGLVLGLHLPRREQLEINRHAGAYM